MKKKVLVVGLILLIQNAWSQTIFKDTLNLSIDKHCRIDLADSSKVGGELLLYAIVPRVFNEQHYRADSLVQKIDLSQKEQKIILERKWNYKNKKNPFMSLTPQFFKLVYEPINSEEKNIKSISFLGGGGREMSIYLDCYFFNTNHQSLLGELESGETLSFTSQTAIFNKMYSSTYADIEVHELKIERIEDEYIAFCKIYTYNYINSSGFYEGPHRTPDHVIYERQKRLTKEDLNAIKACENYVSFEALKDDTGIDYDRCANEVSFKDKKISFFSLDLFTADIWESLEKNFEKK